MDMFGHRTRRIRFARRRVLCAALAAALPVGAQAARLEYDVSLRYMHSDNIVLQAADEISEDIGRADHIPDDQIAALDAAVSKKRRGLK